MADTNPNPDFRKDAFVSWREFLGSAYMPALALVCLSVWLHAADSLVVATMLPSIVAEIGGAGLVGWSVSLYEIASVVAGAASALLTMRYGLRGPMCLAALVFGLGCFLSAFAPTMLLLLAGRVFQGLGGGGLVAMGFVAVGVIFPRRYTARAMAAVSTFWGVSAFLGPLIGGFFVEFATWRWGFAFFGGQAIALALWIALRPDHAPSDARARIVFPWRRLALLCLAVLLVSYGGVEIEPVQTTLCVLSGVACLVLFLRQDHHALDDRLLPLRPFDFTKPTGSALLMILSLSIATIAITAFGPLLVVAIHNASALTAGYIVACSSIGWTVMAVLVSGSPERLDRLMIAIGMALVAASIAGFLYAVPNGPVWLIAVFAALEGGGFGMAWTFILRRTTALSAPQEVQRISGAIPTIQRLGYALGAAYSGIIANACQRQSKSEPKGSAKCYHFGVGMIAA
ncbi:MFS transporter [Aquicoccus porphyridii]|uniref:MFS transporter n=1 Tax=Aquicoccus porphyridii TaxID=1852029 RepID=A0A5A9YXF5_9RHOB|nr:MFS transporter [Aquicoccus porphyridii]KAA0909601.1 MFS transporter [Aquicoccus porphyridii]RAI51899.1 MFS transporter [Rhodobacteraceae bacterium AsT-22]